ncbi:Elongin-C [Aphelenchoides fujianensis]|nr:Elongin-C [Aphelenchoides fujianensis]
MSAEASGSGTGALAARVAGSSEEEKKLTPEKFSAKGPDSTHVKFVSADGHEFFVRRSFVLNSSATVKGMLTGPMSYGEDEEVEVNFKDIDSHIMKRVSEYWGYYTRHTDNWYNIPDFPIKSEIAIETLLAASFLQC